jgi:hypothetical protein
VAFWRGLGFSAEELRGMLASLPRLLLYPAHELKYQLKLRFLRGGRGPGCSPARLAPLCSALRLKHRRAASWRLAAHTY